MVPNDVFVRIIVGESCNCFNRRAFDGQCKQELRLNPTFKIDHWNVRWLQESEYNIRNPSINIYRNVKEQGMLQLYDKNSSTAKITCNLNDSMSLEHNNTTMTEIIDVDLPNEEFVE